MASSGVGRPTEEVVVASSSVDGGIVCWRLHSGAEERRYRCCASPSHGLLAVSSRFLASSQLGGNDASIYLWSWDSPQVQVKSFPAEPIGPLISNSDGCYIIGGGSSGDIYLWEVGTGKLLRQWNAHYRSVTCLILSSDESLLISGSQDGSVKVWVLLMVMDDVLMEEGGNSIMHSFSDHSLCITCIVSGYGLTVISSSEDRTCKIWSLSEGRLLRSITFPTIIDAIAMDPGEHTFFAGGRDGKIYVAALHAKLEPGGNYGKFIIGSFSDQSKAINCLAFSTDGVTLVSGSEDGTIRIWNASSGQMTRLLKHGKGPVSNILVVRQPINFSQVSSSRKHSHVFMVPPLDRYIDSRESEAESWAVKLADKPANDLDSPSYCSATVMNRLLEELQQNTSSGALEMELERLREECKSSMQMAQQWKKMYHDLESICVNEFLSGANLVGSRE